MDRPRRGDRKDYKNPQRWSQQDDAAPTKKRRSLGDITNGQTPAEAAPRARGGVENGPARVDIQ
eukprot:CAMPEP_0119269982 /NCGR_PEP_ID=MMETSP1329-20130426/7164_1 /TAXON_ID=114041 /ORGANISM="Genus nov. species nov., Strain RCC1024" /LENGTH=63 /DNA_ID=CAMNT_0007269985 /DNA_START=565 /DNA_END=756 /DNA_ORIENTATION=-